MAVTAILDSITTSIMTNPARWALPDLLGVQIWWKSVKRFKSYSTLYKFKMAAAAILNFGTSSNSIKLACSALQDPLGVLIGWISGQRFNSYSFLSKFKMAAAAILDFAMVSHEVPTVILFYKVYFDFKFDENRLIASNVTAVFQNIDFGWDFSI